MKKTVISSIICLASLSLVSCGGPKAKTSETNDDKLEQESPQGQAINYVLGDTQTTTSGLKVIFKNLNSGPKPSDGDVVKVHYKGTLANGKEFDNSYKRNEPIPFVLGQGQVIKGWDEGVALLGKGDKATFVIPPSLGYGDRDMGNGLIPANSTLIFDVELVDFIEGYKPYDITGKDSIVTASGLKFYVIEQGDLSKKPKPGQTAVANYAGYLTNGTKFDASFDRGQPFEFPVGQGRVIKGWDEVIQLMGIGSKYKVVIPPTLGYGAAGAGAQIPGNATLIFDMELLGIK
jgi:FKBP-type peptidyl-prolyl cis-trans isomerase